MELMGSTKAGLMEVEEVMRLMGDTVVDMVDEDLHYAENPQDRKRHNHNL